MRNFLIFFALIFITSCARNVEPTVENINKIFSSQDFTFEFHQIGKTNKSISFRDDYLVYKSDQPTIRREITYDEVLLINNFIQKIVNLHKDDKDIESSSFYVVKNTAYKTTIIPEQESYYFEILLKTLKLNKQ
ncbi:hypothetical protein [uncultured Aquimarina sp.]|uniref:hypothetical protein n=1 Tax=uncultured Aquimarina sp. TaxID=575652 RepID=UPI00262C191F|nr:hypothetical protein [uncultured Aquimarina sp.]